ncbi:MAG TPA: hypothetical protein ENK84_03170 [Desulfobulbus sp.]|nr:hypothetical protein [Desulfobulbus sp.]HHD64362.1 hypothetical protein [Desulfobulbaceae bacterium]
MKRIGVSVVMLVLSCFLASCVHNSTSGQAAEQVKKPQINYIPDASRVKNPIKTITTLLEEQPPAYGYIPSDLKVTDKAIRMTVAAGGYWFTFGAPVPGQKKQEIYYYKTLGTPVVSKPENESVWNVQIMDKHGNVLYWLFTDTREDAERFADALYYMILHHK